MGNFYCLMKGDSESSAMETSAVLKPQAGWYSSHWSIVPASVLTRPFTVSSSRRVNQPLAGLQDLYRRATFLLGVTSGLPVERTSTATGGASPSETAQQTSGPSDEIANRPVPTRSRSFQTRVNPQSQPSSATGPVSLREAPDPAALPAQSEPAGEPPAAPETYEAVAAHAEVLVDAVNRLGEALKAHDFLAQDIRDYGAELIDRFAETLAPYGLSSTDGSLKVDREKLAGAFQENPQQVAEAFWGPNSPTPDITSLAAAIVGAPGTYLMEPASPSPETYQPFQGSNPWFRVAPTGFYQVA
jgi:hypothetical protein